MIPFVLYFQSTVKEHFAPGATNMLITICTMKPAKQKWVTFPKLGESCLCKQAIRETNETGMLK